MTQPTVRSARRQTTADSSVTKPTVDLSGGISDEVCVVVIACDKVGASVITADGAGWTKRWDSDTDSTANNDRLYCFTKTLSAGGGSETFTVSGVNEVATHAYVLTGATEIPAGKGGAFGSGLDTLIDPTVSGLASGDYLAIWAHGRDAEAVTINFGTGTIVGPDITSGGAAQHAIETAYVGFTGTATGTNTCGGASFKHCQGLTLAMAAGAPPVTGPPLVQTATRVGSW